MSNITVIGAGITGLLAAYYLAKDGHTVSIVEQERYPAMRTSFANGCQISVSNSEVWTNTSNVSKSIRWLFKKDAPLLIRPKLDLDQISWLLKFLKNSLNNSSARNTIETIQLGMESRSLYKEIIKNENIEFDQSDCGILHFYKDHQYFEHATIVKEMYNAYGCGWDIVDPYKIGQIEPTLKNVSDIIGGAWTPDDWVGDIHKFCYQLATILETKYNVLFYWDNTADINEIITTSDFVVVSAGIGSQKIAKTLGENLSIYPVKGYSITIYNVEPELLPKVSLLDDQAKIVTATIGNRFRVAGTAEFNGENYDIRRDRIEPLLNWVETNFPQIDTRDYSQWACLRPMTPNMMPIVKRSTKNFKVLYHTGHGHLGWTLSPATANRLAKLVREIT